MLANLREMANRFNQAATRMPWVGTRKTDPLDAGDIIDRRKQVGKVARWIVRRLVVIDDLAEQLNLAAA